MNILEIKNLSKSFGKLKVINNLNLQVANNNVFGFLGKNGAGKTTIMKMVMGLLKADRGNILVTSQKVHFGQTAVNKDIGYLPDVAEFYEYMTPKEYLMLSGQISGLKSGEVKQRIKDLLPIVGLEGVNRRIQGFSRGMKQRLGIAQALLHQPKLLLCDEPTSALDPVGRKEILEILSRLRSKTTIVFSTHILSDVERICDQIGILHNGTLALQGKISKIKETFASESILLQIDQSDQNDFLRQELLKVDGVRDVQIVDKSIRIISHNALEVGKQINKLLATNDLTLIRFEKVESDLEQVFLEVIKR